ncbi:MAG: hypothetical protein ACXWWC_12495 [Chitinophagaceae bacterium]
MTQSKASIQSKKIEQVPNLRSLLLSRFCRVNTTYNAERLIEVNHIKNFDEIFINIKVSFLGMALGVIWLNVAEDGLTWFNVVYYYLSSAHIIFSN